MLLLVFTVANASIVRFYDVVCCSFYQICISDLVCLCCSEFVGIISIMVITTIDSITFVHFVKCVSLAFKPGLHVLSIRFPIQCRMCQCCCRCAVVVLKAMPYVSSFSVDSVVV